MRGAEKGAHSGFGDEAVDAVAGANYRVHAVGHFQAAHILAHQHRLHALAAQPCRRRAQHFLGSVHADDARAAAGQFHRHKPRSAARVHNAPRRNARAASRAQ